MYGDAPLPADLFPDLAPSAEAPLRQAQLRMLRMLQYVDRVCEEIGARYALLGGTLLGAIRHRGFIPWDDDLDIGMPREDYERFARDGAARLPAGLTLHDAQNDPEHRWPWMKLRDHFSLLEERTVTGVSVRSGLFIDIFPLDVYSDELLTANWWARKLTHVQTLTMRAGFPALSERVERLQLAAFLLKGRRSARRTLNAGAIGPAEEIVNPFCRYLDGGRPTVRCADAYPLRKAPFEGHEFPIFGRAERYLEAVYGPNYMTPPRQADREAHAVSLQVAPITSPALW